MKWCSKGSRCSEKSQAFGDLGKECSRQKKQQMQRPCGSRWADRLKTKQASPCGQRTATMVKRGNKNWPGSWQHREDLTLYSEHLGKVQGAFWPGRWHVPAYILKTHCSKSIMHRLGEGSRPTETGIVEVRGEGELVSICRHFTGWVKISLWIWLWWRERPRSTKEWRKTRSQCQGSEINCLVCSLGKRAEKQCGASMELLFLFPPTSSDCTALSLWPHSQPQCCSCIWRLIDRQQSTQVSCGDILSVSPDKVYLKIRGNSQPPQWT